MTKTAAADLSEETTAEGICAGGLRSILKNVKLFGCKEFHLKRCSRREVAAIAAKK